MSARDLCTSVPGVGGNTGRVRHAVPQKHFKWEQPIPVTVVSLVCISVPTKLRKLRLEVVASLPNMQTFLCISIP